MNLKEFREVVSSADKGKMFNYGISPPFSWRGVYEEVAFSIIPFPRTREQILVEIDKAISTPFFYGHKGGAYSYDDDTEVHFEEDRSGYSDGGYCSRIISEIEQSEIYESPEIRLVKLAFS
jgi:hypothetical protein